MEIMGPCHTVLALRALPPWAPEGSSARPLNWTLKRGCPRLRAWQPTMDCEIVTATFKAWSDSSSKGKTCRMWRAHRACIRKSKPPPCLLCFLYVSLAVKCCAKLGAGTTFHRDPTGLSVATTARTRLSSPRRGSCRQFKLLRRPAPHDRKPNSHPHPITTKMSSRVSPSRARARSPQP